MRQRQDPSRAVVTRGWLYRRYVMQQRTAQQIADETGWSSQYIRDRLRAYGIALRPPGNASKTGTRLDQVMLQRALAQGRSGEQIAAEAGYSRGGVYRMIRRHRLPLPAAAQPPAGERPEVLSEVVRLYRDELLGLREVGERFGRGSVWARARVVEAGVPVRQPGRRGELGWVEQLEQLAGAGLTTAQIAARVGRSPSTVSERLREAGLTAARPPRRPALDAAALRRLYGDEQHTIAEIARLLQVSARRVGRGLVEAGIARRRAGPRVDPPGLVPISGEQLREMILLRGRSAASIAAELGCSRTRVLTALTRNEIPKRAGRWRPPPFDHTSGRRPAPHTPRPRAQRRVDGAPRVGTADQSPPATPTTDPRGHRHR
jgi:DNA-binding CsgD family transcriptional regulator